MQRDKALKKRPLAVMRFHGGEGPTFQKTVKRLQLLLPAVDYVDHISDEHGQDDDDKTEQGIVVHGFLLFSERGEFVDDEVEALRKCTGTKAAGVAGDDLAIELHTQRRRAGNLSFLGLDDLELRATEYLAGGVECGGDHRGQ